MSWIHKPANEQRAALARGEISSLGLLEETISHTEKLIPYINPIALRLYDRARDAAMAADKKLARRKGGPLCGLPITIKDSQWLAGYPCANGSTTLQNFVPDETSKSIQRLEEAGAVIFAKTTCPEFSLSGITESELYGRTANPWDLSKTPGGSSGGCAAAIAAGIGSLSLGGDGGGSIRIPSAFCGVTGFKPSFGLVPRAPGFSTWESLVAYGPVTRSVADAKLMFSVLSNIPLEKITPQDNPSNTIPFVVSEDLGFAPVDVDVRLAFRSAIDKIISTGQPIKYDNPGLLSSVVPWAITATYDMWEHKSARKDSSTDMTKTGRHAREFVKFGGSFSKQDFDDAQAERSQIHDAYMAMFKRSASNILLTPTLGCEAFEHGTSFPKFIEDKQITYPWLDWAGFLYDSNLVGMPACSIPIGIGDQGLPISLQIVGPPGHDSEVLSAAEKIEQLVGWQYPQFNINNYLPVTAIENPDLVVPTLSNEHIF